MTDEEITELWRQIMPEAGIAIKMAYPGRRLELTYKNHGINWYIPVMEGKERLKHDLEMVAMRLYRDQVIRQCFNRD